jgi:hypothetical protein
MYYRKRPARAQYYPSFSFGGVSVGGEMSKKGDGGVGAIKEL